MEVINLKYIFHFYFLNMGISVTIYVVNLNISVYILRILLEGSVSQIF